jgi:putative transposase
MAPHVDRQEIRWEHPSWAGTTARVSRDPSVDRAYGQGQSRLGYTRIQGALVNLNHDVSRGTIASILSEHGLEPAPERVKRSTWTEFLKTHWDVLAATDFFCVHVWTGHGLARFVVLFVIDLSTRRVQIAGITSEPDSAWMTR